MEETYNVKFIVMPKEKAKHEGNMLIVLRKIFKKVSWNAKGSDSCRL